MTNSSWLRAVPVAVTAVLLVTTVAVAGGPHGRHGRHDHMQGLQQHLGLTDQQVEAIREVHERQAEARKQHAQALRQAQTDLRQLVLNAGDEAAIQAKQAEVAKLLADSVAMRVETLKQIGPILTPEQREKFAQGWHGGRWRQRS
ncbi:MAG TPA: Spy/CpxP family protein refolding chaperone [Candidatus Tectomicrobia bacterium]|nr:Spy/CpxP family protein refolding chaperone [Candidatus Tectomicrobia bacterium]